MKLLTSSLRKLTAVLVAMTIFMVLLFQLNEMLNGKQENKDPCPVCEAGSAVNVTTTECEESTPCGAALQTYYEQLARLGNKWWFCPKLHDILWNCLKPLRKGQKPLSNFYLLDNPKQHIRDYKEANLAFLHVPKCGGTSINDLVYNLAGGQRKVHDIRHCAHFYKLAYDIGLYQSQTYMMSQRVYGFHHFANQNRPFLYFAWFRHPVDRGVSQFYFLQKNRNIDLPSIRNKSLTQYLKDTEGQHHHVMNNFMVRLLQFGDHREIDDSYEMRDGGVKPGSTEAPEVKEEHFLTAKRNLLNDIGFVGILEDFKTSQDMFCFMTGSKCPKAAIHKNRNAKRPNKNLTEYEQGEIEKRNTWDIKLYQIAVEIYEKQKSKYLGMSRNKG